MTSRLWDWPRERSGYVEVDQCACLVYFIHVNNNVVCGQRCYKQRQRKKERGWNIIIIYARNAIDLIQSRVDMALQGKLI